MHKTTIKPISRKSDLVIQELGKEILIYDLKVDKAFSLNETSALIWNLCDGDNSVFDISVHLSRRLNTAVSEDFVRLALDQLQKDNLVEIENNVSFLPVETTRREMIRRVGLASMVALPFISSLAAPAAAQAQSGCGAANGRRNGCACGSNGNCSSNCCGAIAGGAANQVCVATGSESNGSYCRAGCECASDCCASNACASSTGVVGSACSTACQCAAGCCANNLCANDTVASGGACTLSCQCIGASTCSGGGRCT